MYDKLCDDLLGKTAPLGSNKKFLEIILVLFKHIFALVTQFVSKLDWLQRLFLSEKIYISSRKVDHGVKKT